MIIAVDGPTASGKGTLAKALAAHGCCAVRTLGALDDGTGNNGSARSSEGVLEEPVIELQAAIENGEVSNVFAWILILIQGAGR